MKLDFTGTEAQNPDTELTIKYLFLIFFGMIQDLFCQRTPEKNKYLNC